MSTSLTCTSRSYTHTFTCNSYLEYFGDSACLQRESQIAYLRPRDVPKYTLIVV